MIEIMNLRKDKPTEVWDFIVDRRTPVGNPFIMQNEEERDKVCRFYNVWFKREVAKCKNLPFLRYLNSILSTLRIYGKVRLFCWCTPKRCHAETIKAYLERTL